MGWKWNDIANQLQDLGLTPEQVTAVDGLMTAKKWELVGILEQAAKDTQSTERQQAFREVIAGVKPHGPRP